MSSGLCLPVSTTGHIFCLRPPPARPPLPLSCSPLTLCLCCCPLVTRPLFSTHPQLRLAPPLFPTSQLNFHGSLSLVGGVGARSGYSREQPGPVRHGKSVVVLQTKTLHRILWCALIGDERGKMWFHTADACNVQSHTNVYRRENFKAGIFFRNQGGNCALLPGRKCGVVWLA